MGSRKITSKLVEMIRNGEVAAGSYLPSTRELAEKYQVSLNTVHAAVKELAGRKLVECRPRRGTMVLKAAKQEESRQKQIGMLMVPGYDPLFESNWRLEWGWAIFHAFEAELFEAGFSTVMVPWPAKGPGELIQRLENVESRILGIIAPGCYLNFSLREAMEARDIPWVSINQPVGADECRHNFVSAANQEGGREVGRLFAEAGFEQVVVLAIDPTAGGSSVEKVTGFFQGYLEKGLSTENIRVVNCRSTGELAGYQAVRRMLAEKFKPRGIFATGDVLALGAIHALRDEGIAVPGEISVVGATGLSRSAKFDPPLTVVRQPMEAMGRAAGQMILQMVREGVRKFSPRRIPCELILRKSTKGICRGDGGGERPKKERRQANSTDAMEGETPLAGRLS